MFGMMKRGWAAVVRVAVEVKHGAQALAVSGAIALGSLTGAESAHAAIDPAVAAGVTALEADAATLGGIVTGAVITIMLIVLGVRLLKKLFGKAV